MQNSKWRVRRLSRGLPLPEVKAGYRDALAGRPFSSAIAAMPPQIQKSYHSGRLYALELRAAGTVPPPWRDTVKGLPDTLRAALRSNATISPFGSMKPIVTERDKQPDDPNLAFTRPHLNKRGFPNPIPTYCAK